MTPADTIRTQLGLPPTPSDWTYDQRTTYNSELATYIRTHPAEFSPAQRTTAEIVAARPAAPLLDDSFDWGMFGDEVAAQATELNPVPSLLASAKWLLPALAVLAVVLYFAPRLGTAAANARARHA